MQSGELIVTGKDQISISLHGLPAKVCVEFGDEPVIIPCNPKHFDELEWELHEKKHDHEHHHHEHEDCHTLIIRWDVSAVREIKWTASY